MSKMRFGALCLGLLLLLGCPASLDAPAQEPPEGWITIGTKKIAVEITEKLRRSTTVDWQVRESVRAKLRILVRRTLQRYKYPPDKAPAAIELIMEQAEALSNHWTQ